jgi:cytochrome c
MRSSSALLAAALAAGFAASAHAAPAGDAAKGEDAFEDRCTQCHTIGGIAQGPNLAGVVGRKAGASPGFPYTAALKASGLTWTPANLERFIAGPQALIPGTAMTVTVPSAAERANIVAYLATLKGH